MMSYAKNKINIPIIHIRVEGFLLVIKWWARSIMTYKITTCVAEMFMSSIKANVLFEISFMIELTNKVNLFIINEITDANEES